MLIINIAMLEYQIANDSKSLEIHLKSTPQPLRIRINWITFASPSAMPWDAMGHGQREAADRPGAKGQHLEKKRSQADAKNCQPFCNVSYLELPRNPSLIKEIKHILMCVSILYIYAHICIYIIYTLYCIYIIDRSHRDYVSTQISQKVQVVL